MRGRAVLSVILLFGAIIPTGALAVGSGAAGEKAPQWLLDEIAKAPPTVPADTDAVVLLDEQSTEVSGKGVLTTVCRRATKILRPGGVEISRRLVRADSFDTKVKSMTGWVVREGGETRKVTMKQAVSTSLAPDTLYMDVKFLILSLPDVDVGSVVAFESEEVRSPASLEDSCELQGSFPIARAHYELTLPLGWKADFHWVHREPAERTPDPKRPQTWCFDFKDIPAMPNEPQGPPAASLMGRLIVRVITAAQDKRSYTGWTDMGRWYEELSRDERAPDEAVAAKAAELAPEGRSSLERIRALAAFVQKEIRYVSIQIGIGGFEPHKAPSVLANRYGDCKDKATLLAALLEATGVPSYFLIVNTDRGCVTMDSPVSLYSFNHAILAIRLPDDVPDAGLDGLVRHPRLGRLLVFDPTMPTTPPGRLPFYLQGNTALLVAEHGGELTPLPHPAPESNVLDRQAKLTLSADGACAGEVQEVRRGSLADAYRYRLQASTEAERRKILETFLSRFFASFTLKDYDIKNLEDPQGDLIVSYRFTVPSYAKRAGGLLVVRPRVLGQKAVDLTSRAKGPRQTSIDLLETTALERDEFSFELPEGCAVEDLPKPVDLEAGFALYKSATEAAGRRLTYRREYRLREPTIPAARYDEAVKFYLAVGSDEKQVALVKQGVTGGN
jgi:transglutaminase-like putative cysteine protease